MKCLLNHNGNHQSNHIASWSLVWSKCPPLRAIFQPVVSFSLLWLFKLLYLLSQDNWVSFITRYFLSLHHLHLHLQNHFDSGIFENYYLMFTILLCTFELGGGSTICIRTRNNLRQGTQHWRGNCSSMKGHLKLTKCVAQKKVEDRNDAQLTKKSPQTQLLRSLWLRNIRSPTETYKR